MRKSLDYIALFFDNVFATQKKTTTAFYSVLLMK